MTKVTQISTQSDHHRHWCGDPRTRKSPRSASKQGGCAGVRGLWAGPGVGGVLPALGRLGPGSAVQLRRHGHGRSTRNRREQRARHPGGRLAPDRSVVRGARGGRRTTAVGCCWRVVRAARPGDGRCFPGTSGGRWHRRGRCSGRPDWAVSDGGRRDVAHGGWRVADRRRLVESSSTLAAKRVREASQWCVFTRSYPGERGVLLARPRRRG